MNQDRKEKESVFRQSFDEVKAYFKGFRFDKPHLKAALPFFLEMLFFVFIITLDLTLKDYLYKFVVGEHGGNFTVIDGFFDLTYSENTGMGFGVGQNSTLGITIITFIIVVVVICYLLVFRKDKPYIRVPLVMVAAGGIGNLVDRIAFGYVRDFFEFTFMDFAIFNVADSFITVGAIVLIIGLIVMMATTTIDEKKKVKEEATAVSDGVADAAKPSGDVETSDGGTDGTAEDKPEAEESDNNAQEKTADESEKAAKSAFTIDAVEEAADGADNKSDKIECDGEDVE